jgi:hypothetical protein
LVPSSIPYIVLVVMVCSKFEANYPGNWILNFHYNVEWFRQAWRTVDFWISFFSLMVVSSFVVVFCCWFQYHSYWWIA